MRLFPTGRWQQMLLVAAAVLTSSAGVIRAADASIWPPLLDLSGDRDRQTVVAQGTRSIYQGHPTTVLLPDGKTIFCVWSINHGGPAGPMKRSDDGGRTWSELLPTPPDWPQAGNCPAIYRLTDPKGKARLIVFCGHGSDKNMCQSVSEDDGQIWSPMRSLGFKVVMPFCTIQPIDDGKKLLALTNIRRPGETKDRTSNVIAQSESADGGLTWSVPKIILDLGELKPCEPEIVRSPDGKQLLCLLRENLKHTALFITSEDEGRTWSAAKPLPPGLYGDRHKARYASDGRLVVVFRDTGVDSSTRGHFLAWVGRYEDMLAGRDAAYRIKLLHNFAGKDCGYPGLEVLPDGTFVATTYVKYREGAEKHSVVSTRFQLTETDTLPKTAGITPVATEPVDQPKPTAHPPGYVVVDDNDAELTGEWVQSNKLPAKYGNGYRHDNNRDRGEKTARFTANLPKAGEYEVRLIYAPDANRASRVPVTIKSAEGEKTIAIDQRSAGDSEPAPALGVFRFASGRENSVSVSNDQTDGFVVIDAVEFVPIAVAQVQRAVQTAHANSPKRGELIKKPSRENVQLATSAMGEAVNGKSYDLVVVGGTSGGVACAVRAAREGHRVLLVQHTQHIGGMMVNGLGQWDALYGGPRAPIFSELLGKIEDYYRTTYGEKSRDFQLAHYSQKQYPIGWAEPHVAEREFNRLVAGEKNITLLLGYYPSVVQRDGALLRGVTLREYAGKKEITVTGTVFADCTYEGDLFALAKVPYRVGREARDEYHEPHAGKIFTNIAKGPAPLDAVEGRLNIRSYSSRQGSIDPSSPFTADGAVQAYNYRPCVTSDLKNRILVEKPEAYDRETYLHFDRRYIGGGSGPNHKSHMNSPIMPGENHDYPEADWPTREKITRRHLNFALGLIYFLQNDESLPEAERQKHRQWGLPRDEFPDNSHVPYEMYVREARRIVGRHVLNENDCVLAADLGRSRIQPDSVATTDWYMDSHSCTTDSRPGFHYDGKLILTDESRPSQIPYRSLLPQGVDNLLVPVCLSATHVAWGAVRLEPVWMQTGEAAGLAASLALGQKITPGQLDPDKLLRALVERRMLVTFFNDLQVDDPDPATPAAQYFGTKGFFHDYNARLSEPLKAETGKAWMTSFSRLKLGQSDPMALALEVATAEKTSGSMATAEFMALLGEAKQDAKGRNNAPPSGDGPISRGAALQRLWSLIN